MIVFILNYLKLKDYNERYVDFFVKERSIFDKY